MSVLGVGIDLVGIEAFAAQLGAAGSAFAELTFTAGERLAAARGAAGTPTHLAGRFAAKEAFIKAFSGARIGRSPALGRLDPLEVEVLTDGWGRPSLVLHGAVAQAVGDTLGPVRIHLSLTHEDHAAAAVVVLESGGGA